MTQVRRRGCPPGAGPSSIVAAGLRRPLSAVTRKLAIIDNILRGHRGAALHLCPDYARGPIGLIAVALLVDHMAVSSASRPLAPWQAGPATGVVGAGLNCASIPAGWRMVHSTQPADQHPDAANGKREREHRQDQLP